MTLDYMNPTFKGGSLGESQADLLSSPFVEQEPVGYVPVLWDPSKSILCFARSGYSLEILNLSTLEFFSVQKQWSSCRDSPLLTAQYPKPASGSFGFPRSQLQTKYLMSIKAFKHTQCSSIFFDDSDWVALHPLCSFLWKLIVSWCSQ